MARFDRAVTVFSPNGELLQVQYAQEAVRRASAVVGVRGLNTIAMAAERKAIPKMQDERTEKKIVALDDHVMLAFAGHRPDARVMIVRSRIECQSHRLTVDDPVTIEYITRYVAEMKQKYTQTNGRRPFGISCLIGGFDFDSSPHLYQTEPSGVYYEWKAIATGRCDKVIRDFLEKNYNAEALVTEEGVVRLAVAGLLQVLPKGHRNIDVAVLKLCRPMKMLPQEVVNSIAKDIERNMSEK